MQWDSILSVVLHAESGSICYCIAVGKRSEDFFPKLLPPVPFARRHRQSYRRFSLWMADDSRRYEQPEAQAVNGYFRLPTQMPLKQDGEVVGEHGQA